MHLNSTFRSARRRSRLLSVDCARSPPYVIVPCVWSKADYVTGFVHELARRHGLAVYDPQSERITYPDDAHESSAKRSWWRFW